MELKEKKEEVMMCSRYFFGAFRNAIIAVEKADKEFLKWSEKWLCEAVKRKCLNEEEKEILKDAYLEEIGEYIDKEEAPMAIDKAIELGEKLAEELSELV